VSLDPIVGVRLRLAAMLPVEGGKLLALDRLATRQEVWEDAIATIMECGVHSGLEEMQRRYANVKTARVEAERGIT
jgi:hypothetical protein